MQIFEWWIVLIGAVTTILIAIKTMSGERSDLTTAIGVAAIVFSTLGTSIATLNSFYTSRLIYERDERALQALQALHLQLATGITRQETVCDPPKKWPEDWRVKRIKELTDQYAATLGSTPATVSAPEGADTGANGAASAGQSGAAIPPMDVSSPGQSR
jgi:hypothetical protein